MSRILGSHLLASWAGHLLASWARLGKPLDRRSVLAHAVEVAVTNTLREKMKGFDSLRITVKVRSSPLLETFMIRTEHQLPS